MLQIRKIPYNQLKEVWNWALICASNSIDILLLDLSQEL